MERARVSAPVPLPTARQDDGAARVGGVRHAGVLPSAIRVSRCVWSPPFPVRRIVAFAVTA
jgi:hypothetical protein